MSNAKSEVNPVQIMAKNSLAQEVDDYSGIPDRAISSYGPRLKLCLWKCLPISLRLLLTFLRTLPLRIREERKIYWDVSDGSPLIPTALAKELASFRGIRTYRHAYIEDMTRLQERYPFLTTFDLYLVQRAWNDGTRCTENNVCTVSDQKSSRAL